MSILCDGLHKTVVEGSIWPGPLVIYQIAYETNTRYGPPVTIQKVYTDPHPTKQTNPIPMGDEHNQGMYKALNSLLSGQLQLTENRKLLTDRPKR